MRDYAEAMEEVRDLRTRLEEAERERGRLPAREVACKFIAAMSHSANNCATGIYHNRYCEDLTKLLEADRTARGATPGEGEPR